MTRGAGNRIRQSAIVAAALGGLCVCLAGCRAGWVQGGCSVDVVGATIGGVAAWFGVMAGLAAADHAGGDPGNGYDRVLWPGGDWSEDRW